MAKAAVVNVVAVIVLAFVVRLFVLSFSVILVFGGVQHSEKKPTVSAIFLARISLGCTYRRIIPTCTVPAKNKTR